MHQHADSGELRLDHHEPDAEHREDERVVGDAASRLVQLPPLAQSEADVGPRVPPERGQTHLRSARDVRD